MPNPTLTFKNRFIQQLETSEKTTTLRKSTELKAGQFFNAVDEQGNVIELCKCLSITKIVMTETDIMLTATAKNQDIRTIYRKLNTEFDGFDSFQEFQDFIKETYGLPFDGVVIEFD